MKLLLLILVYFTTFNKADPLTKEEMLNNIAWMLCSIFIDI